MMHNNFGLGFYLSAIFWTNGFANGVSNYSLALNASSSTPTTLATTSSTEYTSLQKLIKTSFTQSVLEYLAPESGLILTEQTIASSLGHDSIHTTAGEYSTSINGTRSKSTEGAATKSSSFTSFQSQINSTSSHRWISNATYSKNVVGAQSQDTSITTDKSVSTKKYLSSHSANGTRYTMGSTNFTTPISTAPRYPLTNSTLSTTTCPNTTYASGMPKMRYLNGCDFNEAYLKDQYFYNYEDRCLATSCSSSYWEAAMAYTGPPPLLYTTFLFQNISLVGTLFEVGPITTLTLSCK
jgi:hypothetical protein